MTSNEPDSVDAQDSHEEYLEQLAKEEDAAADDCPACGGHGIWFPDENNDIGGNHEYFECYTCGYMG